MLSFGSFRPKAWQGPLGGGWFSMQANFVRAKEAFTERQELVHAPTAPGRRGVLSRRRHCSARP